MNYFCNETLVVMGGLKPPTAIQRPNTASFVWDGISPIIITEIYLSLLLPPATGQTGIVTIYSLSDTVVTTALSLEAVSGIASYQILGGQWVRL